MKRVHRARDLAEAHLVRGVLQGAFIDADVRGEQLASEVGVRAPEAEMRPSVWVAEADHERAVQVLAEYLHASRPGEALLDLGVEADDAVSAGARRRRTMPDGEAQRAISELFVVADRLARDPRRGDHLDEAHELAGAIAGTEPPFGVDAPTWQRIEQMSAALAAERREAADEDRVREAAGALRDVLRQLV